MKVIENGKSFDYLKDAIVTDNCYTEVIDKQLVINIKPTERFLKNVKTYSEKVALRNSQKCALNSGNTYFTRLHFAGKIKLIIGVTTLKINFQNTVVQTAAKIYKYDETTKMVTLVASTDFNSDEYKVLTTTNQEYINGDEIYYYAIYTNSDANLLGMNCNVSNNIDPPICFKYNGQPESFAISEIQQSLETFSASINTYEEN